MSKTYHFKHQYAFNQFGQVVTIDEAEKNQRGEKFYKDFNRTIEFIFVNGSVKAKHFREPSEYTINHNGQQILSNQINESAEHHNFKMKIIKDGFFIIDEYKIYIQNPKDEYVLVGSKYRVDLYANLLCGTPVAIEIIKTSDISANKLNYINEYKILTFKLYIDDYGNQKHGEFDIIGNETIERIKHEYIKAKNDLNRLTTRNGIEARNIEARFKVENETLQKQYRKYIEGQDARIDEFKQEQAGDVDFLRQKIYDTIKRIRQTKKDTTDCIQRTKQSRAEIQSVLQEVGYYKQLSEIN